MSDLPPAVSTPLFPHADSIALLSQALDRTVASAKHWHGAVERAAAREPSPTQPLTIELFSRYAADEERKADSYRASLQLLFRGGGTPARAPRVDYPEDYQSGVAAPPAARVVPLVKPEDRAWHTGTTLPPPGPEVPVPSAHVVIYPAPTEGVTK